MKPHKDNIQLWFKEIPDLNLITWQQYTPYFNDGDTCEFSVNDPAFSNYTGDEEIMYDELDIDWDADENKNVWLFGAEVYGAASAQAEKLVSAGDRKTLKEFAALICSGELSDVMLATFGDHVTVSLKRNGTKVDVETNDYEHD